MRLLVSLLLLPALLHAQTYFPPSSASETWETVDPVDLGWCVDVLPELESFLDSTSTKAFIVLKDGKIALEYYLNGHDETAVWQWNSAGKALTALLTGIAQEDGYLDINDKTSDYLGTGWTSMTPAQEDAVTIWHQLTMTTGMDDEDPNWSCLNPSCFNYVADAGTRWSYHNAPYRILSEVLEEATGLDVNVYTALELSGTTGIAGLWLDLLDFKIFFSTARSMARFGLLIQEEGIWDGNPILSDSDFFNDMVSPSQNINNAYGYLWWLNGQEDFMLPGTQAVFPGTLIPNAPASMISGIGADGQIVSVIPEEKIVIVRMGQAPGTGFVTIDFPNLYHELLNELFCVTTGLPVIEQEELPQAVYDLQGRQLSQDWDLLPAGIYIITDSAGGTRKVFKR